MPNEPLLATAQAAVHPLRPEPSSDAAAAASVRLAQWQLLTEHLAGVLYAPLTCGDVPAQVNQCAGMLRRLVHEDADLAIFLVVNDHPGKLARYSAAHALHTATLVSLIARRKDWSPATELCGIQAALTMNIAMTQLQDELAQQSSPLTPEQRQIVHQHPLAGRRLLMQLGVTDTDWLDAVLQHHEQAEQAGRSHKVSDVVRSGWRHQLNRDSGRL